MTYQLKRKKYKKHVMELKFLRSEISYQEEVLVTAHQDFDIWYRQWCRDNNVNLVQQNKNNETRVSKILSPPKFPDLKLNRAGIFVLDRKVKKQEKKKFQGLFKQVAKETHPDKHEGRALDFKTASAAYEAGDWAMLLQIAEDHGIIPDDLDEVLPIMVEESKRLRKLIKTNKSTYSWRFSECESDKCKEQLVKKFLKQLFNLEL